MSGKADAKAAKAETPKKETPAAVSTAGLQDKMSIYIPGPKLDQNPVGRLQALGEKLDRSVNYLVVDAILQYLDREENS